MVGEAVHIKVRGLVQGVGFRPAVYKLAVELGLKGRVFNSNGGVEIVVEGTPETIHRFSALLPERKPPSSTISLMEHSIIEFQNLSDFEIDVSRGHEEAITTISPDIAVCPECLHDLMTQNGRIHYPLINCTQCGPRFSIVSQLPYDRANTTMAAFEMCKFCGAEYNDPANRRFHAQPVACNACGPKFSLHFMGETIYDFENILQTSVNCIEAGGVLTLKDNGGFHLLCDATNLVAVSHLRKIKLRDAKPFAVMFGSIDEIRNSAFINDEEEKLVESWMRPVVILQSKQNLPDIISNGLSTIGAILPYMPFHYILFEKLKTKVLVFTSANLADEPLIINNTEAINQFAGIGAVVTYNRDIQNRVDDSVMFVSNQKPRFMRRARGFVPLPIDLPFHVEGVFATGAELSGAFCIGKAKQAFMSQHLGDLKSYDVSEFYRDAFQKLSQLFRFVPQIIACDSHPDYFTSQFARELKLPIVEVQHHHAHIASCMAEHKLDEELIGLAFDGMGLGNNGTAWGGEFMLCSYSGFERLCHFDTVDIPGGDAVSQEPWKTAIACLLKYYPEVLGEITRLFPAIDKKQIELLIVMLKTRTGTIATSSVGRLFDAVAALTGLCCKASWHAEAPMRLQNAVVSNYSERYDYIYNKTISLKPLFQQIIADMHRKVPVQFIASKFQNTLVSASVEVTTDLCKQNHIRKVVLSGGVFQNPLLLQQMELALEKQGYEVYAPLQLPCNDGGIALGQLAIAAHRM